MSAFAFDTAVLLAGAFILWQISIRVMHRSPLEVIRGPSGGSYMSGHLTQMFDISSGLGFLEKMTAHYGGVVKFKGPFNADYLWISDPRGLEEILLRATHAFEERRAFTNGTRVIFGPGLLSSVGEQHKKQRRLLNPVFSSSNIRNLVPLFFEIGHQLRAKLTQEVQQQPRELDIMDWLSRAALEFIGQGGLGYSFGALDGQQNEYRTASKNLPPAMAKMGILRVVAPKLSTWGPPWFRRYLVDICPLSAIQRMKEIVDVMDRTSSSLFFERKKILETGNFEGQTAGGKDIFTLMLDVDNKSFLSEKLSDAEMRAQVSTFLFAGHDTTSGALARVLDVLSQHPDIQEKLRQEVITATEARPELNYEQLSALPLLDAVCRETLRLHPPVTTVARECLRDAVIPLTSSVQSVHGDPLTQITVPKGTTVWISIRDANRNTKVWGDDAALWKPERWLTGSDKTRLPGIYSSMMTFLGGERACIGFRIAILEIKLVLAVLLPALRFDKSASSVVTWHFGASLAPFVKGGGLDGEDSGPELPMKIGLNP